MDLQEELINSIRITLDKALANHAKNTEIATVVTAISSGQYQVKIDGNDYWVKDGVNIHPTVGTAVWVKTPNGKHSMNEAYICAKR
ncbi:hypothetical protein V1224_05125 [Lachnospiraceae bacterium JLR.KK008]